MKFEEKDIKHGVVIKYNHTQGILVDNEGLFGCYWVDSVLGRLEEAYEKAYSYSKSEWIMDSSLYSVENIITSTDSLDMFRMLNPGHDKALKVIFEDLYEF